MNILMLLDEEFPPDSRVRKEALSLIEDGHKVTIACHSRLNLPNQESIEGIEVRRMNISRISYKLRAACLVIPFYFYIWRKFSYKIAKEKQPDIVYVHDLPLSKVGYFIKKKFDCKLICDQHEYYSDWIIHTAHMNTFLGKIVKGLSDWKKYERKYLELADLVITVAEPLRKRYLSEYCLNKKKLITIPNTPSLKIYNRENINPSICEKYNDSFVIFYAGGLDILRGIDTAIKSLKLIRNEIPDVKLILAGKLIKPFDPIKISQEEDVEDLVDFIGWIDENDLPSYIASSNVCFFTPPTNRNEINETIATKIYQYAAMEKPIIVSDAKLMKEFVENNNLGVSIPSGDYKAFAEAVIECMSFNPESINREIITASFWEKTVTPLCQTIKNKFNKK